MQSKRIESAGNHFSTIKLFVIIAMAILVFQNVRADDTNFRWRVGETLTYKVNWSFVKLGKIKLVIKDTLNYNDHKVYHIRLHIDSNPMLFFVDMHSVVDTYIDDQMRLHRFYSNENIDGVNYLTEYNVDYDKHIADVTMTDMKDTSNVITKQLPFEGNLYDGTSLIFYARRHLDKKVSKNVTVISKAELSRVKINFKGRDKNVSLDAIDQPVGSFYVNGLFDNEGFAGLSGPFEGWFANDPQAPPLKARLKVFIGSVSLELIDFKKWSPEV